MDRIPLRGVLTEAGWARQTAAYAAFAIFAGLVALLSGEPIHRMWGAWAAGGYLLAAVSVVAGRRWPGRARGAALGLSLTGAVLVPLALFAASGMNMPEVSVIEHAAALLTHHGSPYESPASLAGAQFQQFNPYLPAMTIFGLPHAVFGPGLATDPRLWAGATFVALCALSLRVAGARRAGHRTAFLAASPLIAFPLAVSGNDLPILGLLCLGLAYAAAPAGDRRAAGRQAAGRPVMAGLVLGLAAAMKATAWPVLPVAAVLLATRHRPVAAARFAAAAAAVLAAVVGPFAARQPGALIENTLAYPLGLTAVKSPAASPLPGHLLASAGQAGHLIAVALLVAAGAAVAGSLAVRPPATLSAAAGRLAIGLALMFTLAPASRWGYFVYPAGLCAWLLAAGGDRAAEPPGPAVDLPVRRATCLTMPAGAPGVCSLVPQFPSAGRKDAHEPGGVGTRTPAMVLDGLGCSRSSCTCDSACEVLTAGV